MENIILSQIPLDDLKKIISEVVREELAELVRSASNKSEPEFISRQEVSNILGISLPTLHEWTKNGKIPAYKIGSRVRYKKNEVHDALQRIETMKYGRRGH